MARSGRIGATGGRQAGAQELSVGWELVKTWLQRQWLRVIDGGRTVNLLGHVLVLAATLALAAWPQFRYLEWKLYDKGMQLLREHAPQRAAVDVVVIGADEASFASFDEPLALWHRHIGAVIGAMTVAKPAVLGLDIVLPAKSFDAVVPGIDRELMRALLSARGRVPVVLGESVDDALQPRPLFAGFAGLAGSQQIGSVLLCLDDDGVVRRVMGVGCAGDAREEHMGLAQRMAAFLGAPARGAGLIDYRVGGLIPVVSMVDVLKWHAEGDHERLKMTFGGKAVFLGVTLPLEDRLGSPVALSAVEPALTRVPGVMVHAQVLRTLTSGGFVKQWPRGLDVLATAVVSLLWFVRTKWRRVIYLSTFLLLPLFGLYLLWLGYASSMAMLLFVAQLAYGCRSALDGLRDRHERLRLRRSFAGHVSNDQLRLLSQTDLTGGGTAHRTHEQVTVLHVMLGPQADTGALPAWNGLAWHYATFRAAVQRHGGMVERLSGLELVASFNLLLPAPEPERQALEAALQVRRARGSAPLEAAAVASSMGLATGTVHAGILKLPDAQPWVLFGPTLADAREAAVLAAGRGQACEVLVHEQMARSVGGQGLESLDMAPGAYQRLTVE
jgi:adenylate cyclase